MNLKSQAALPRRACDNAGSTVGCKSFASFLSLIGADVERAAIVLRAAQ
jgi:hypothetical protein